MMQTQATSSGKPLRVIQWATGNIGSRSLRGVLEHPDLELAGLYAHSAEKAGQDAGQLCGLGTTGIAATRDIDEIVGLGADCVLYMPLTGDLDVVCRLLSAGTNIVTTRGEFHRPESMPAEDRQRVEAACRAGGTSIHSTGSSPGFVTEALPLVLSSVQRRLERLAIREYANLSRRDTPAMLFDIMGFGREPAGFSRRRLTRAEGSFGPSLRLLADSWGLPLDSVEASGEIATARHDTEIAAGLVRAGTVAGQRITADGRRGGKSLVSFTATWFVTPELDADWELRDTGWRIEVHGDATMDVDIRFPVPLERFAAVSPGYTANRAVNAVPVVCAAAPGIRTAADLPQVVAALA